MSNPQRAALLLGAVAVLVAAFVVLRPSDDEPSTAADTTTVVASAPAPATTQTATTQTTTAPKPKPRPKGPLLTAAKVTEIEVRKGDTVRFRARSQADDEVHVHGYDISKDAPAGETISMSFPAKLEGIFEIEFEVAGTEIARLTVNP